MAMTHPNAIQIRKNRRKLLISRIFLITGLSLIAYDYYLTYLTPFWDFDLLLNMFIVGCVLVALPMLGKLWRRIVSRRSKASTRQGECVNCGACCRIPVRCVFLFKKKCMIHHNRPKQCRTFPSEPGQLVSYKCGYFFKE